MRCEMPCPLYPRKRTLIASTHPGEPNVNLVLLNVTVQTPKDGFCVRGDNVMRRITVLAVAGAVTVGIGVISFALGRALTVREPAAPVMLTKVAPPVLVTGTIASRAIPVQAQPQAPSAPPVALPPLASPAAFPTPDRTKAAARPSPLCSNPDALGVSRVVEIDTTGGPGFGFETNVAATT